MAFRYQYNSYTSKPMVNRYLFGIDVSNFISDKNDNKNNYSIEEYAEFLIQQKEKNRGYKFSSNERRKLKRQYIRDLKKGKKI